jgi:NADH-quinone oxidoreductase subunit J
MDTVIFWILAGIMVAASLLVVGQRNPMHSVLLLIVSFGALSGLYVMLDAPFVAVTQIIIYAGAVMVLFVFVIMLLNAPTEDVPAGAPARMLGGAGPRRFGAFLSVLLVLELVAVLVHLRTTSLPAADPAAAATARPVFDIGLKLFKEYAFAFEATSVLILVAMVGAIVLARREQP